MGNGRFDFTPSVLYQKEILENEVRNNPTECFEKWNIFEVRVACLKQLNKNKFSDKYFADWAEYFIEKLTELGMHDDRQLSDKLLEWYVFKANDDNLAARAIEFAIYFDEKEGIKTNFISKLVAGRLGDDPQLYSRVPSLKKFLHKLLDFMIRRVEWADREYTDFDWFAAERAQSIIVKKRDRSFLPKISKLIEMLETGVIIPSKFSPEETLVMHLARLRFTREKLEGVGEER